jgi:hypothetical protein
MGVYMLYICLGVYKLYICLGVYKLYISLSARDVPLRFPKSIDQPPVTLCHTPDCRAPV